MTRAGTQSGPAVGGLRVIHIVGALVVAVSAAVMTGTNGPRRPAQRAGHRSAVVGVSEQATVIRASFPGRRAVVGPFAMLEGGVLSGGSPLCPVEWRGDELAVSVDGLPPGGPWLVTIEDLTAFIDIDSLTDTTPLAGLRQSGGRLVRDPDSGFDKIAVEVSSGQGDIDIDVGTIPPAGKGPVLVAGVVVDESGAGVGDADVTADLIHGSRHHMKMFSARTDAGGRFALRGTVRARVSLRIRTESGWAADDVPEVLPGATGVRLEVGRTWSRHGSVELPEGAPLDGLVVRLLGTGIRRANPPQLDPGSGWSIRDGCLEFPAQGQFRLDQIRPGEYDVELRMRGDAEPLTAIRGWNPEFGPIPPLRPDAPVIPGSVRVLLPDGSPAVGALVFRRRAGNSEFGPAGRTGADGVARFALRAEPAEVAVRMAGFALSITPWSAGDRDILLVPAVKTTVTLRQTRLPPAEEGVVRGVELHWRSGPGEAPDRWESPDDDAPQCALPPAADWSADGVATLTVEIPGWYAVWTVQRRRDGSSRTSKRTSLLVDGTGTPVTRDFDSSE